MCSETSNKQWDFTPVIDLINSLSPRIDQTLHADSEPRGDLNASSSYVLSTKENDTYLGLGNFDRLWQYLGQPSTNDFSKLKCLEETRPNEVLVKEFNSELTRNKGVRWRDEVEGAGLAENDGVEDNLNFADLSRSERKKKRRYKRRERSLQGKNGANVIQNGSENDSEYSINKARRSQDRKAVIDDYLYGAIPRIETSSAILKNTSRLQSLSDQETWPIAKPLPLSGTLAALFSPEQTAYATVAEKKGRLIKKLSSKFGIESRLLGPPKALKSISNGNISKESGIHVFVDASNILIGFHNALMISRGFSIKSRIRRQPLSFPNLSLVLERGRPTAKRVLVGSDNFPAVMEAKSIGYETNILERVQKAKELTPRQKKYGKSSINNKYLVQSSGSETATGIYAPEKWVEQAVDEVLHLKILESIVDAKVPSTIVLATGDAAEAEYSQGFLKMVERALEKGWMVELVSFRHNTSMAYRKKDFRNNWRDQFMIIELDEFVEELLGV